ncbi:uncharacterized protein LOC111430354 [Cucurbita moschata]|uniref:Uncharacterized protein LOC111430354 n=1 Tax=Cucurbita moschata TaxID=3662 RepID=A0A6J1E2Z3_CUCMO|nr:uncharacterized protein LOC111430354 [Cucurbita moschata]
MGFFFFFFFPLILTITSSASSMASLKTQPHKLQSTHLLDLYIRDFTLKSLDNTIKTGAFHTVPLPENLTGITVDTARFRCGSLRRYGASVREFHLGVGVSLNPCAERIVIIRQNLGSNWSSIYFNNYHLIGYQLVSSILGLLAYNPGNYTNTSSSPVPSAVGISTGEKPITIDFRNSTRMGNISGIRPICASFERDGRVTLAKEISPLVCSALRQGHFGLVVEQAESVELRKKEQPWKVAVGSSIGAAIGAFLLGLLLVAMFVRVKQRTKMEEMEIRAYEEEALQVSMVGHVRAPTAPGTRTSPSIENEYLPPSSRC